MKELQGNRVLITDTASGIGRVMAKRFESSGTGIWICDSDPAVLKTCLNEHSRWKGTVCDVSDPESVIFLFLQILNGFGRLEVFINNVGIAEPTAVTSRMSNQKNGAEGLM